MSGWEVLKTQHGWVVADLDQYAVVRHAGAAVRYDTIGKALLVADRLNNELTRMEALEA